ncbi:hypothetical protein A2U01_0082548 [Trifolium medium]|uniref:Uncharacterized protein n=1 Tax=Trifolium medium TaxID=97028 RepID=A0A392TJI2_9FABA|nr:hypothetical protein [Trifolium medium]
MLGSSPGQIEVSPGLRDVDVDVDGG